MKYTVQKYFFVFLIASSPLSAGELQNITVDTLAVIGGKIITVDSFVRQYKEKLVTLGLTDNGETRGQFLQNLVNDEIFIARAKIDRLDKTKEGRRELLRLQQQELLNAFTEKNILSSVVITENDLKILFEQLNTKRKVRHLYAATKEEADSLYVALQHGATFESLAEKIFHDPALKNTGGQLGDISVDDMDPTFEQAAFALQVGEVSAPIKTVEGYSIIRVDDIQRNPFITEDEYAKSKERLRAFERKRKYEEAARNYSTTLKKVLNVQVDDAVIGRLFNMASKNSWQHVMESQKSSTQSAEVSTIAVKWNGGAWTVNRLITVLSKTAEEQRKWIRNIENFKEYVTGLVLRNHIIRQAKKEKLDQQELYKKRVEYNFDTYLLNSLEAKLQKRIAVADDSVAAYYRDNKERFAIPSEVRLSSILLEDSVLAGTIQQKIFAGIPFAQLSKEYSVQTITASHGGDMGFFTKKELGKFGDTIFSLRQNAWAGPLYDGGKFLFLQVTDITPITFRPFDETKEEIITMLRTQAWYRVQKQFAEKFRKKIYCRIFPERILTTVISLNNY
jgi:parvulin-like peptidyl-prolyl isomerase